MGPPHANSGDVINAVSDRLSNGFERKSVQVIAESGVSEVPENFVQPPELQPSLDESLETVSVSARIPIIDMRELKGDGRAVAISKLATACQEWGFFQVINHGVEEEILEGMKAATRGFFGLPMEVKQRWAMKENDIEGYGRVNTGSQAATDWVDIVAQYVAPESSIHDHLLPSEPPSYREALRAYVNEMKVVTYELCGAISESLGLEANYIEETSGVFSAALRLNYYPPCPQPDRVLGVGAHSDGGTITLLIEDGGPGLQVRKDGQWVTLKLACPNAIIVNVADMLQVISNGIYTSVDHQAIVNQKTERYSIVMFFYPEVSPHLIVKPAPKLITQTNPTQYREISYLDYLSFYLGQGQPGKARVHSLKIQ